MKKGFLIIDGNYNTVFVPGKEFSELVKQLDMSKYWMLGIHMHKTRAELNKEITDYIRGDGYYSE